MRVSARAATPRTPNAPLLLSLAAAPRPASGESWPSFRQRAAQSLAAERRRARAALGLELAPLLAAGALAGWASPSQLARVRAGALGPGLQLVEWEGAPGDGGAEGVAPSSSAGVIRPSPAARVAGRVTVAILDSGIDLGHPFLSVESAVSVCPEGAAVPGRHATHCAGLVASRSSERPGIAPGARLLSVKVARASGSLMPAWIAAGVDAALDLGAQVLSISCGLNRLPPRLAEGHGWACRRSGCPLCRSVDSAVACGAVVVAAAGNLGRRAGRRSGGEVSERAWREVLCPARARGAIAVGVLDRGLPPRPWPASSRQRGGPPGRRKPEILAPGVDVVSTVPTDDGDPGSLGLGLFGAGTGTSVAAALVAGAVALVIEEYEAEGRSWSPQQVRRDLLERCSRPLEAHADLRCLDLAALHRHERQGQRNPSWIQPRGPASA